MPTRSRTFPYRNAYNCCIRRGSVKYRKDGLKGIRKLDLAVYEHLSSNLKEDKTANVKLSIVHQNEFL